MIVALLVVYLTGWVVTSICAFFAANRLRIKSHPAPPYFTALIVLAGALWPLLLVGVVELGSIITYAKLQSRPPQRALAARPPQLVHF